VITAVVIIAVGKVTQQYGFILTLPGIFYKDIFQKNPYCHGRSGYYVLVVGTTLTLYNVIWTIWSWSVVERKVGCR